MPREGQTESRRPLLFVELHWVSGGVGFQLHPMSSEARGNENTKHVVISAIEQKLLQAQCQSYLQPAHSRNPTYFAPAVSDLMHPRSAELSERQ